MESVGGCAEKMLLFSFSASTSQTFDHNSCAHAKKFLKHTQYIYRYNYVYMYIYIFIYKFLFK